MRSFWAHLDPMDSVCLHTASMEWNVRGKCGPHGELFFFLIQKKPAPLPGSETFSSFFMVDIRTSFFSAYVLKKCALIALHLLLEEGRGGEDGCHALGLRQEMGCPKSPLWESRKTKVCLSGSREGNVGNGALHVIGLHGPGGQISFVGGLGAGKGVFELPHGPGHAVPGNA